MADTVGGTYGGFFGSDEGKWGHRGTQRAADLETEFGTGSRAGSSSQDDQLARDRALGGQKEGLGDYSNDAAEKRDRYDEWAAEHGAETNNMSKWGNPGSADYGGEGGVEFYRQQAIEGAGRNDTAQRANESAMGRSLAGMGEARGPQYAEDPRLTGRLDARRMQQLSALGQVGNAAAGGAPSEAAFQTTLGMQSLAGQQSGNMGQARGLAALGGAQSGGAAGLGQAAGSVALQGGMGRGQEIGEALGMYGAQSGDVRAADLARLKSSSGVGMFNADSNEKWRLGNAALLAGQGKLGVSQGATDLGWMDQQQRGAAEQFRYDQEMAALEAGGDADKVAAALARSRESAENKRQLVAGGVTAGLGAVGSLAGPVGTAAGVGAGNAINSATKNWW